MNRRTQAIFIIAMSTMATSIFATVSTFPYHESFETGLGDWAQSAGDDFDWTLRSGSTWTSNTGPSGAHDRNYYLVTDSWRNHNDEAIISQTFDFSGIDNPTLSFFFHMHGVAMGGLFVEVNSGTEWGLTGQQHTSLDAPWSLAEIDLSDYGNMSNVQISFRGKFGPYYTSHMCIDDIWVYEAATMPDHFVWSTISDRQTQGQPIPVEITAVDQNGQTLTDFDKKVELSAWSDGFPNACQNGDFEDGELNFWTITDTRVGGQTAPSIYGSANAFALHPDTIPQGITQEITLAAGEQYTITAKGVFYNDHNTAPVAGILSAQILINGTQIAEQSVSSLDSNSQWWHSYYGFFTAPSNGTYTLSLVADTTAGGINSMHWVYFDDVSINNEPAQYVVTDPSISDSFTNGVWTGNISVNTRLPATRLIARYGTCSGESSLFSTYTSLYDADGDGMLDSWEESFFTNSAACLPLVDFDQDGYSNLDEFTIGSDPTLKSSSLALTATIIENGPCILNWFSAENRTYDVQWTPDLAMTPFSNLDTGLGFPRASYTNDIPPDSDMGFYRIKVR